ncbi:hypothetical protein M0R45_004191 [Rubus argutus]|uniref:Uncharacterized protein n=1 Tax=Rubus argutus TaxID=59490 RepID=A0AAW1YJ29_RUBAR
MINAIRSIRTQSPALTIKPSLHPASNYLARKASRVGFRQASTTTQPTEPDSEPDMGDKPQDNPRKKSGDSMSHSFGEGYATRCDDDGFGVIYGRYESATEVEQEQLTQENHPNDNTQGSEVKEKETARHQTNESA